MKTLGNILWVIFGGLELAIGYLVAGVLLLIPVVTIPLAVQALKLAPFVLWPFGKVLARTDPDKRPSAIGNLLWLLLAGIWLAIGHLVAAAIMAVTIVGLPLAIAHVKLANAVLFPFGKEPMPAAVARQRGLAIEAGV